MKKRFQTPSAVASAINDAFSAARQFRESHIQIDARVKEIRDELRSKTPAGSWRYVEYMRHYAEGYLAARYEDIWRHVEFCYRDACGVLYSTHHESTHRKTEEFYASGRGAELSTLQGAHVWKGTERNYTPWGLHGSTPHIVTDAPRANPV
jgi:hypothetical protein